jgi:hypothetical protein
MDCFQPESELTCDSGGVCSNVQWEGYTCDNEYFVNTNNEAVVELQNANGNTLDPSLVTLTSGVTYRFTVFGNITLCASIPDLKCASRGPLLFAVSDGGTDKVSFTLQGEESSAFELSVVANVMAEEPAALPSGAIAGIVVCAILVLVIGVAVARKMRQANEPVEKPQVDSAEEGSSEEDHP